MRMLLTLAAVVAMSIGLIGCTEKKEAPKTGPPPKIELGKGAKENKQESKKEEAKKEEPKKEEAAKPEEKPAPPPEAKKEEPKPEEKK